MKKLFITRKRTLLAVLIALLLTASMALAGNGLDELRSLTASGGSQVSSGSLSLASALGQPVAGSVGAGDLIGASGFWTGAGVQAQPPDEPGLYLFIPLVMR